MDGDQEKKFHKKNNQNGPKQNNQNEPKQNNQNGPKKHNNKQNNNSNQNGPKQHYNKQNNNNKGPRPNRSNSKPRYDVDKKFSEMSMGGSQGGSDVLKLLECPICMDPMVGAILTCETGHSICQPCAVRVSNPLCPLCRSKITLQRNFSLEQVAQGLVMPCSNHQYGCKYHGLSIQLPKHSDVCDFRPVACPLGKVMSGCTWEGPNAGLSSHVNQSHSDKTKYVFGKEIQISNFSTQTHYADVQFMSLGSDSFLLHLYVNVDEKIAYFAVQYIGQKYRAKKWKYTVHLYNKSDPMKKIEVSEMCSSDSDKLNNVFMSGECVAVPLHVLRHYIHKDNQKLIFKVFTNYQKNEE